MDTATEKIKKILELTGFKNPRLSADEEHRKISIVVDDEMNQTQTAATLGAVTAAPERPAAVTLPLHPCRTPR